MQLQATATRSPKSPPQPVHRAHHPSATTIQHMGVNHGRADVPVAQEFLHRPDVVTVFE